MDKRCAKCDEMKPASSFNKNRSNADGLQNHCRACQKIARDATRDKVNARRRVYYAEHRADIRSKQAEYRSSNKDQINSASRAEWARNRDSHSEKRRASYAVDKERILAQQALYRAANKDVKAASDRAWALANRDRRREYSRRYRQNNLDAVRATARRYVRDNKEKINLHGQRYRARKHGATVVDIVPDLVELRMAMFGHRCWMCGGPFEHVDHVKPLAQGGAHMLANLRPACQKCNQSKNARWYGPAAAHAMRSRRNAAA